MYDIDLNEVGIETFSFKLKYKVGVGLAIGRFWPVKIFVN